MCDYFKLINYNIFILYDIYDDLVVNINSYVGM